MEERPEQRAAKWIHYDRIIQNYQNYANHNWIIWSVIPSLFSYTHPHTLLTWLILIFIFHITSSRYHITPHLISPSIIQIPRLSPITSLTSYYSTHYHVTSQLTHHHIYTMTTSHSPADDGRKNSSESSCYILFYCYFYVFTHLYKSLEYWIK